MIIRSVGEVIAERALYSVTPDTTVREACEMLDRQNIGALAVIDGTELVGVISERDVIRRAIGKHRRTDETLVRDIMSTDPVTVSSNSSLADAMSAMIRGGFRHLPVVDGDRVRGMLSMRDIPTEYRLMFERYTESFSELSGPKPMHA